MRTAIIPQICSAVRTQKALKRRDMGTGKRVGIASSIHSQGLAAPLRRSYAILRERTLVPVKVVFCVAFCSQRSTQPCFVPCRSPVAAAVLRVLRNIFRSSSSSISLILFEFFCSNFWFSGLSLARSLARFALLATTPSRRRMRLQVFLLL